MQHEIAVEAFEAIKAIIRRGIMTLLTLRDPDRKYQHKTTAWLFPVVNSAQEAYGYVRYGFEPTPHDISQMEIVAGWLSWLRRTEGEGALRRIISWTLGVPKWRIGTRERCSERTILNRIDRSVSAIIRNFAAADINVEFLPEPKIPTATRLGKELGCAPPPYDLVFERPGGPHGLVMLRKVYVYDKGFMVGRNRQWKELRDGREKLNRLKATA